MLQWPVSELNDTSLQSAGLYRRAEDQPENERKYRWARESRAASGQPLEIVESLYQDPKQAVADLLKGNIEVIDRLFPADAALLRSATRSKDRGIQVESYALPMVHMLVPQGDHPYLEDRDFRRALLYAIDRQAILDGEILGGARSPESRLISGPFPIGQSDNDPLSYAYNQEITPVPYDPRLAQLLTILTRQKLAAMAAKTNTPEPEFRPCDWEFLITNRPRSPARRLSNNGRSSGSGRVGSPVS